MEIIKKVIYPDDYFDFSKGKESSNEEIQEQVDELVKALIGKEEGDYIHVSYGNLLIIVEKEEMGEISIKVCEGYRELTINEEDLK